MNHSTTRAPEPERPLAAAPSRDLVIDFAKSSVDLIRKEVGLARLELSQDLRKEMKAAAGLGAAGMFVLLTVNALLAAVVLILSLWLPAWAAALIVAGLLLLAGGSAAIFGWASRVRIPLERTKKSLKEDVRWAKKPWT